MVVACINGVATISEFSYKEMYGNFARTKKSANDNNEAAFHYTSFLYMYCRSTVTSKACSDLTSMIFHYSHCTCLA